MKISNADRRILFGCLTLLFAPTICHAELYKWQDEHGRTNYGDIVPKQYKKSAVLVDQGETSVSEERRREAEARYANEKSRLKPKKPEAVEDAPPKESAKKKNEAIDMSQLSCAEQWKLYNESWDCFSPFMNANGTINSEAYETCTPVNAPSCMK